VSEMQLGLARHQAPAGPALQRQSQGRGIWWLFPNDDL